MRCSRRVVLSLSLLLGFTLGPSAWATVENLKSYKAAYPDKEPKAYSCKVCHENAVGKKDDLNAYGLALQAFKAAAGAKKLTEEDYRALEGEDADEDGATNLEELTAGTDPSDPESVPEGAEGDEPEEGAVEGEGGEGEGEEHEHHHEDQPSSAAPHATGRVRAYLERLTTSEAWAAESAEQPSGAEPPQAEYVGIDTCAACHAKQFKEFQQSTHARISIPGEDVKAQGCEMCHGPGSLHAEAGGGRGVGGIINPRKDPSTCFACHLDKKAEFRLPYHHPLLEGKMSCADCHTPHEAEVRPWSATTLRGINEACFRCHKEQRGPFVWEHEALREGCTTCHKVHGSIHDKMLLVRDANLCLRCHTQTNFPIIGRRNHGTNLGQGTCFSGVCHTAPHGSNFDEHLRY